MLFLSGNSHEAVVIGNEMGSCRQPRSEHIVQFFDSRESLANSVAAFLAEGCRQGERLLVVAKPRNWLAIAGALKTGDHALSDGTETSLTVVEADAALSQFMRHGLPDSLLFHETVGNLVRKLAAGPSCGFRIYGEMVDVLAGEGNFHAAQRLEELWNELAVRYPFVLLCGYSSSHFASRDARESLRAICATHSRVHNGADDLIAGWLVDDDRRPAAGDRGLPS
jgi:hypothetical protein